jgi:hypothetical protein
MALKYYRNNFYEFTCLTNRKLNGLIQEHYMRVATTGNWQRMEQINIRTYFTMHSEWQNDRRGTHGNFSTHN